MEQKDIFELLNKKQYLKAIELLKNSDDGWSKFCLGVIYYTGLGGKPNFKMAYEFFQLSTNEHSLFAKACCLFNGRGVKKNKHKAIEIFKELKNIDAYNALGVCYANGIVVEQDADEALDYFCRVAKLNSLGYEIGWCYNGNMFEIFNLQNVLDWQKFSHISDAGKAEFKITKLNLLKQIDNNEIFWDAYNDMLSVMEVFED